MHRYARGDDAALDELYRLGAPRVRSFLARLCADLALADDLTQDAFLRIHAARGTFARGAPALPWMFAIARNSYRDHLRRENVRRAHRATAALDASAHRFDMPERGGDRAILARQMLNVVQEALMGLPVRQREAFVLLRFEGLSLIEAAAVLGATEAAVKILVHRAYVVVRAALEAQDPDGRAPMSTPRSKSKSSSLDRIADVPDPLSGVELMASSAASPRRCGGPLADALARDRVSGDGIRSRAALRARVGGDHEQARRPSHDFEGHPLRGGRGSRGGRAARAGRRPVGRARPGAAEGPSGDAPRSVAGDLRGGHAARVARRRRRRVVLAPRAALLPAGPASTRLARSRWRRGCSADRSPRFRRGEARRSAWLAGRRAWRR